MIYLERSASQDLKSGRLKHYVLYVSALPTRLSVLILLKNLLKKIKIFCLLNIILWYLEGQIECIALRDIYSVQ